MLDDFGDDYHSFNPDTILAEFFHHVRSTCREPPTNTQLEDMLANYMVTRFGTGAIGLNLRFNVSARLERWMQKCIQDGIAYQHE